MKKKILNQLIAAVLVCGSLLAVGNIPANAEEKTEPGMKTENGQTYCYNAMGKKVVNNWVNSSGKWYHFNDKGEMEKNTTAKDADGKDVQIGADGIGNLDDGIKEEKITKDSSEAYKNSHKQWKKVVNDWYYYTGSNLETMLTDSWCPDNGIWYYFNDKGIMQKNATVKDEKGNDCVLNADGALTNRENPEIDVLKWKQVDGNWYYMTRKGEKALGWTRDETNGKWYYLNIKDGIMQKNTTIIDSNGKYVLGADGAWIK